MKNRSTKIKEELKQDFPLLSGAFDHKDPDIKSDFFDEMAENILKTTESTTIKKLSHRKKIALWKPFVTAACLVLAIGIFFLSRAQNTDEYNESISQSEVLAYFEDEWDSIEDEWLISEELDDHSYLWTEIDVEMIDDWDDIDFNNL